MTTNPDTPTSDTHSFIPKLNEIARNAGAEIKRIYHSGECIGVKSKEDDSPVTKADIAAHHIIVEGLAKLTPEVPILSEEGIDAASFEERKSWSQYWLVDPLDGTKEFINRTGEFTVNIALVQGHDVVLGVVYLPEKDLLYYACKDYGAYRVEGENKQKLSITPVAADRPLNVVASRRHGADALEAMLKKAASHFSQLNKVSMGSSLKICALAEGKADWYPRLALTSEWDTAAAQIVLEEAGGTIVDTDFQRVRYNTKESLLNPYFHAFADQGFDWRELLETN